MAEINIMPAKLLAPSIETGNNLRQRLRKDRQADRGGVRWLAFGFSVALLFLV
jgi:hypothetical protein